MTKSELDQYIEKYGYSNDFDDEGKSMEYAMQETERYYKNGKFI